MNLDLGTLSPLLISLFGVMFMAFSRMLFLDDKKILNSCSAKAIGTVVHIHKERVRDNDGHYRTRFRPEYLFYDVHQNKERRYTSRFARYPCNVQVGDKTEIFYNPSNPKVIVAMKDLEQLEATNRVFSLFGIGAIAVGLIITIIFVFVI